MIRFLTSILLATMLLTACGQPQQFATTELGIFIDILKENGVEGTLELGPPFNEYMEYVATYVIAAYTSTRILSFFKFKDEQKAEYNLGELMKNPKMSGQARNGTIVFSAIFLPPEPEAVEVIRDLFTQHHFKGPKQTGANGNIQRIPSPQSVTTSP